MSAMLGSKSGVRRVAVVGLGKKDKDDKELTTAALQAIGAQVSTLRRHNANINQFRRATMWKEMGTPMVTPMMMIIVVLKHCV